ncbi:DNA-processing protein DprA [Pusillimonas minor]|uniref:DNA-protecting protein DprA n=1 Tax=Pusillimonas minor TaxID=2697024 RepID=A0A842HS69_9BURK|nr:DNA-processing protein DprA [Pusillimonas minor]MBC2770664.1 DNA-protecting protein DprA [Pusillimonas minor]
MPVSLDHDELAAWVRLTLEPGLGPAQARNLLAAVGLPQAIFAQSVAQLMKFLPQNLALQLAQPPSTDIAQAILQTQRWLEHPSHHLLTLADPDYPASLLEIHDPPLAIYVNGQLGTLNRQSIAIVGARSATPGGLENAKAFARHLAERGWCVVSGLASGIDAAAHQGALDAGPDGGGTLAVMGTGIDIVYPARNRALAHKIVENGTLISEFPMGQRAMPYQFPKRNRIVAGLSRGVLVVEAALQSGSLITARQAGDMGREIFAIPGSIHSPLSKGCHQLIRQGAKLVESGQDIVEELSGVLPGVAPPLRFTGTSTKTRSATPAASGATGHSELEPILQAMGFDPIDIDTLLQRTGLDITLLNSRLTLLELDNLVARLPDGRLQRTAGHTP